MTQLDVIIDERTMRTDDEKTDETNYNDTESDTTVNALPGTRKMTIYTKTKQAMQCSSTREEEDGCWESMGWIIFESTIRGQMLGIHGMDHI